MYKCVPVKNTSICKTLFIFFSLAKTNVGFIDLAHLTAVYSTQLMSAIPLKKMVKYNEKVCICGWRMCGCTSSLHDSRRLKF